MTTKHLLSSKTSYFLWKHPIASHNFIFSSTAKGFKKYFSHYYVFVSPVLSTVFSPSRLSNTCLLNESISPATDEWHKCQQHYILMSSLWWNRKSEILQNRKYKFSIIPGVRGRQNKLKRMFPIKEGVKMIGIDYTFQRSAYHKKSLC